MQYKLKLAQTEKDSHLKNIDNKHRQLGYPYIENHKNQRRQFSKKIVIGDTTYTNTGLETDSLSR